MQDNIVNTTHLFAHMYLIKFTFVVTFRYVCQLSSAITSDHVVNAGDDLMCHIAFLFTSFVVHGPVSDGFPLSMITPILKGHNANMSDSTNFRGIALSSLFGKLFDNIILDRYCHTLLYGELQSGFKENQMFVSLKVPSRPIIFRLLMGSGRVQY